MHNQQNSIEKNETSSKLSEFQSLKIHPPFQGFWGIIHQKNLKFFSAGRSRGVEVVRDSKFSNAVFYGVLGSQWRRITPIFAPFLQHTTFDRDETFLQGTRHCFGWVFFCFGFTVSFVFRIKQSKYRRHPKKTHAFLKRAFFLRATKNQRNDIFLNKKKRHPLQTVSNICGKNFSSMDLLCRRNKDKPAFFS